MRRIMILFLFGVSVVNAQSSKDFYIKGQVRSGGYPVDKFVLMYEDAFKGQVRDTVAVIDGKFSFQGMVVSPMYVNLMILPDSLRVEPKRRSPIVLTFPLENRSMEMDFTAPGKFTIAGSPLYDAYKQFSDSFQHATLVLTGKQFTSAARQFRLNYIKANPSHVLSLLILEDIVKRTRSADELDQVFELLDASLQSSSKGQWIHQRLQELNMIRVGSISPVFTLPDDRGKLHALSQWKGKYVFLHFWASWCMPCREENIHLLSLYATVDTSRIVFVGVSLDQAATRVQWIKAKEKDRLNWTQLVDTNAFQGLVVKSYGFRGVPASFLIDPTGKIEALHLRGASLQTLIDRNFVKRMPD